MVLNDNFGTFLAGHFGAVFNGGSKTISPMIDVGNVGRTVRIIGAREFDRNWNDVTNSLMQVGKGTTPATRSDFKIETVLDDSPEDVQFPNSIAGYNSGLAKITFSIQISNVGGNGQVTEVAWTKFMKLNNNNTATFLFSRDVIPAKDFIIGQEINAELAILI